MRYRKSNSGGGDGSDTARVERQQDFIRAIVDQKVNVMLIAKLPSIYSKMKKNIKTNFTTGDIIKYAKYLNGFSSENIETHNLPGESKRTSSGWYFVCDLQGTKELIVNSFGYDGKNLTNVININSEKKALASNDEQTDEKQEEIKTEEPIEQEEPKEETQLKPPQKTEEEKEE